MNQKPRQPANPYWEDCNLFLRHSLKVVKVNMDPPEILMGILSFALGFERLFKAMLHDVNPLYVLKEDSFKNSVSVMYKERMDLGGKSVKDFAKLLAEKPNADVLTFSNSLSRCCLFSQTIYKHKDTLSRLNWMRDIIAHCPLSELDMENCQKMILGHAFLILEDFQAAKLVDLDALAGDKLITLRRIAIDQADDVVKRVAAILKHHEELYESRVSHDFDFVTIRRQNLKSSDRNGIYRISCPACGDAAEVETEMEYDYCDHESVPVGIFVSRLHCSFCDLEIDDFEELDQMGVTMEALTPDPAED